MRRLHWNRIWSRLADAQANKQKANPVGIICIVGVLVLIFSFWWHSLWLLLPAVLMLVCLAYNLGSRSGYHDGYFDGYTAGYEEGIRRLLGLTDHEWSEVAAMAQEAELDDRLIRRVERSTDAANPTHGE